MTPADLLDQVRAAQLREDRARAIHPILYDYACRITDRWQGLLNAARGLADHTGKCEDGSGPAGAETPSTALDERLPGRT